MEFKDNNGVLSKERNFIQLLNIYKIYKSKFVDHIALKEISCTINPGEISVIMGPSGSGKTTLLNIIGGLDIPNSGQIMYNDIDIAKLNKSDLSLFRRNHVSHIFQFFNLMKELTGFNNIIYPLKLIGRLNEEKIKEIESILKFLNIYDRKDHFPYEMSGGEQQRFAIAFALAKDTNLLLCDEPTGELDLQSKKQIMATFQKIRRNYPSKIIIIVTHDDNFLDIADRLIYLEDGKIKKIFEKNEIEGLNTSKNQEKDVLNKSSNLNLKKRLTKTISEFNTKISEIFDE